MITYKGRIYTEEDIKISKMSLTKIKCDNEWLQDEIINLTDVVIHREKYFLRYTTKPIDDLKVGFSGCFHNETPYTNTLQQAIDIFNNEETEDKNFVLRFMKWKEGTNYKTSKLYDIQYHKQNNPDICYPVFDTRENKYLVNPEFGLSAFILERNNYNDIISNFYMKESDKNSEWHIFKSSYYLYNESDHGKDNIPYSDNICCFLKGEYICNIKNWDILPFCIK